MTAQGKLRKEIENQKELYRLQHSKKNRNALGIGAPPKAFGSDGIARSRRAMTERTNGAVAEVRKARRQRSCRNAQKSEEKMITIRTANTLRKIVEM